MKHGGASDALPLAQRVEFLTPADRQPADASRETPADSDIDVDSAVCAEQKNTACEKHLCDMQNEL